MEQEKRGKGEKKRINKIKKCGLISIMIMVLLIACYAMSWIITCGIIKLITMCFGLTFKWSIATGVWLIICIMQSIFKTTVNK